MLLGHIKKELRGACYLSPSSSPTPTIAVPANMVKSDEQVAEEFNIQTNMSVGELQGWLENPKSQEAGTGVGVESGHKIVDILEKNPEKDPTKYDEVRGICQLSTRCLSSTES